MIVKAEIEFEVPAEVIEDLRDNWGVGTDSWLLEQIEIGLDLVKKEMVEPTWNILGMKVGRAAFGTLDEELK